MIYGKKKARLAYDVISIRRDKLASYYFTMYKAAILRESDILEIQSDIVSRYRVHPHAIRKFHSPIKANAMAEYAVLLTIVYPMGSVSLGKPF